MTDLITKDFIQSVENNIRERNVKLLNQQLLPLHPADIAELFAELDSEEQSYLYSLIENDISANVLLELEEDDRKKLLKTLSSKEIAHEIINEMDTDDAADVINELSDKKRNEVIAHIDDKEHAQDIVELLRYDEDTAGGLMGKELIKVYNHWNVITAVKEMRKQAEDLDEVFSIYVVDNNEKLLGTLSLKRLLTTSSNTKLEELYNPNFLFVKADEEDEEVALKIQKYDLYEIPVVDELMRLIGVITVDDVIDVIREDAEEDYQLAAGITSNVDADDSIWTLTKARLPWLIIGMFGGLGAASIMENFTGKLGEFIILLSFVPLIQSTAGNVGIQSSAIIVQGLANGTIKDEVWHRIAKEFLLGLLNGLGIALFVLVISHFFFGTTYLVSVTICLALITVIINAALIGTIVPLLLNKRGLDPAVSTGPFITTSNDILGVFIYFIIAKIILGF